MGFVHQPMPYPAAFDYGPRIGRPTLAVVFHMAEGQNVAQYLSRAPARGVSVHYTIEQETKAWKDGEVVRCLPERRVSGSINPHTLRRDNDPDGYYGATWARKALGDLWSNPNVAVISVEIAGTAAEGPTQRQQDSMVALYEELDARYGGIAVLAHRDFQNVKMCPGRSAGMKSALARMGRGEERLYMSTRGFVAGQVCDVRPEAPLFDFPGGSKIGQVTGEDLTRSFLGWSPKGREFGLISSDLKPAGRTAWIRAADVANVRGSTPGGEAEYARGRAAGLDEAEAAIDAIDRAG